MGLNSKQEAFVNYYLGEAKFNATRAARLAGYGSPHCYGQQLLENIDVHARVQERLSELQLSADAVLIGLAAQANSDMSAFVDHKGKIDVTTPWARENLKLVKRYKTKVMACGEGEILETEVELYDAQAALVAVGRAHKLFTDKVQVENDAALSELREFLSGKAQASGDTD